MHYSSQLRAGRLSNDSRDTGEHRRTFSLTSSRHRGATHPLTISSTVPAALPSPPRWPALPLLARAFFSSIRPLARFHRSHSIMHRSQMRRQPSKTGELTAQSAGAAVRASNDIFKRLKWILLKNVTKTEDRKKNHHSIAARPLLSMLECSKPWANRTRKARDVPSQEDLASEMPLGLIAASDAGLIRAIAQYFGSLDPSEFNEWDYVSFATPCSGSKGYKDLDPFRPLPSLELQVFVFLSSEEQPDGSALFGPSGHFYELQQEHIPSLYPPESATESNFSDFEFNPLGSPNQSHSRGPRNRSRSIASGVGVDSDLPAPAKRLRLAPTSPRVQSPGLRGRTLAHPPTPPARRRSPTSISLLTPSPKSGHHAPARGSFATGSPHAATSRRDSIDLLKLPPIIPPLKRSASQSQPCMSAQPKTGTVGTSENSHPPQAKETPPAIPINQAHQPFPPGSAAQGAHLIHPALVAHAPPFADPRIAFFPHMMYPSLFAPNPFTTSQLPFAAAFSDAVDPSSAFAGMPQSVSNDANAPLFHPAPAVGKPLTVQSAPAAPLATSASSEPKYTPARIQVQETNSTAAHLVDAAPLHVQPKAPAQSSPQAQMVQPTQSLLADTASQVVQATGHSATITIEDSDSDSENVVKSPNVPLPPTRIGPQAVLRIDELRRKLHETEEALKDLKTTMLDFQTSILGDALKSLWVALKCDVCNLEFHGGEPMARMPAVPGFVHGACGRRLCIEHASQVKVSNDGLWYCSDKCVGNAQKLVFRECASVAHLLLIGCTAFDPALRGAFNHLVASMTVGCSAVEEAEYLAQLEKRFDAEKLKILRRGAGATASECGDEQDWGASNEELAQQAAHISHMASRVLSVVAADAGVGDVKDSEIDDGSD
ncbi:hypothetical protein BCR44DRAFT_38462 [Catenaria anguillulae PL171]|uniref:Uncharacterized protein n=1 Tax=Catenaria anguillulae PL171 TaxID=765915 RepID=A0A1Y2HFM0_9FUNG|nr:hypothetical protein BCR44DRAFT_38462 [Catenaria anguillulae PL171]